jgi:hypothetical protein
MQTIRRLIFTSIAATLALALAAEQSALAGHSCAAGGYYPSDITNEFDWNIQGYDGGHLGETVGGAPEILRFLVATAPVKPLAITVQEVCWSNVPGVVDQYEYLQTYFATIGYNTHRFFSLKTRSANSCKKQGLAVFAIGVPQYPLQEYLFVTPQHRVTFGIADLYASIPLRS